LSGSVHLDATYWGHNWGVLLAIDSASGFPLYMSIIKHETIADYRTAVNSIEERGDAIRGIIIDDMPSLFKEFCNYNVQMCHFHMMQIARRYQTKKPKLIAARELKSLLVGLTDYREEGCSPALLCYASVCAAKIIITFIAFQSVDNFSPHFDLYA